MGIEELQQEKKVIIHESAPVIESFFIICLSRCEAL